MNPNMLSPLFIPLLPPPPLTTRSTSAHTPNTVKGNLRISMWNVRNNEGAEQAYSEAIEEVNAQISVFCESEPDKMEALFMKVTQQKHMPYTDFG